MSIKRLIPVLICLKLNFERIQTKETTFIINGQKPLNVVDERFLSVSIDPAILLNGSNLGGKSMQLAQNLSPAFVRLAGPSTERLKFSEDEKALVSITVADGNFTLTPMLWKSLNYWIKTANLTPVFAISDKTSFSGVWDFKPVLPLLDLSSKMNLKCYWQLGYDCKDKSIIRYKHDLFTLKNTLEERCPDTHNWKLVGSDLHQCLSRRNPEFVKKTLEFLNDATDAVVWQEGGQNPTRFSNPPMPIWLVVPAETEPITFQSGLLWAKQVGNAAKAGYEVIFRQPSLRELYAESPVYWISLLYKTLMGQTVLEIKTNSLPEPNGNIYAHCTKNQDKNSKQGAITILIVNDGNSELTTSVRIATSHPGIAEVHSYILTPDGDNLANTLLNGEKMSLDKLQEGKLQFLPRRRRQRVHRLLNLVSPPKSAAFFVLPAANMPVCIQNEKEPRLRMEKLEQDQPNPTALGGRVENELRPQLPEEYLKSLNWRKHPVASVNQEESIFKKHVPILKRQELKDVKIQRPLNEFRRFLIKKSKATRNDDGKTTKLEIIFTERPVKNQTVSGHIKTVELELTNEEMKKILKDRAKSKVAEDNIELTSRELENILKEATEMVARKENSTAAVKSRKLFLGRNDIRKGKMKKRLRTKREINMELLDLQTSTETPRKVISLNNKQIEATIRKLGQTSEELLKEIEKSSEERRDIYAELASSMEKYVQPSGYFRNPSFGSKQFEKDDSPKETLCPGAKYLDERVQFLMEPSELERFVNEDLRNYRTFSENLRFQKMANPKMNNEIRNINADHPVSVGKRLEMGELHAFARRNQEDTIPGKMESSLNTKKQMPGQWVYGSLSNTEKSQVNNVANWRNLRESQGESQFDNLKDLWLVQQPDTERDAAILSATQDSDLQWHTLGEGNHKTIPTTDNMQFDSNPLRESQGESQFDNSKDLWLVQKPDTERDAGILSATQDSDLQWHTLGEGNHKIIPSTDNMQFDSNPLKFSLLGPASGTKTTNMARPELNQHIGEWSALEKENYEKRFGVTRKFEFGTESEERNPLLTDITKSRKKSFSRSTHFGVWETSSEQNSFGNTEAPGMFSVVKPHFHENPHRLPAPIMASPDNSEPWNQFGQENIEHASPETRSTKDLWKMDIFSQRADANPGSFLELSTVAPNNVFEVNAFPLRDVETEGSILWEMRRDGELGGEITTPDGRTDLLSEPVDRVHAMQQPISEHDVNVGNSEIKSIEETREKFKDTLFSSNHTNHIEDVTDSSIDSIAAKTFKDIETYFCNPKNGHAGYGTRFKRDDSNVTRNDIKNYKKFMTGQLRSLKKSKQGNMQPKEIVRGVSRNSIPRSKHLQSKNDNLSSEGEHLHIVIGKPYDPEKLHINERRRAKQVQKLKQRLQQRKKMNEKMREKKLQQNDVVESETTSSRRKRSPHNIKTNEVSDRKNKMWNEMYKNRLEKIWEAEDILKVKTIPSYSTEFVDKREFAQRTAPYVVNDYYYNRRRNKRNVDSEIDSSENAIDNNPLFKNKNFQSIDKLTTKISVDFQNKLATNKVTTEGVTEVTTLTVPTTVKHSPAGTAADFQLHDNQTQAPEEKENDGIVQPDLIQMIMDAVNSTVSSVVHLSEQIGKHLSF